MIISVRVKPNSSKQEVERVSEKEFLVYLKKPARDGKANDELLKLLKKYFGKPVKIKSGLTFRKKMLEIDL